LILPVVLIVPIAQPLHDNGLCCGVLTPEYGGNAQESVSYRDIGGRRYGSTHGRAEGQIEA
jgi:hypothetical protein